MSPSSVQVEDRVGVVPELPVPVDLADEWLSDSLGFLLDACELPKAALRELVGPTAQLGLRFGLPPAPSDDPAARRKRLDAARLAVVVAALAVEARLNRVLKLGDPEDWASLARLLPLEKLALAPRLLRGLDALPDEPGPLQLADELFELRAELVEAGVGPSAALEVADEPDPRFLPGHARAMVEAGAKICTFLAGLAGRDDESKTAQLVQRAAAALAERAETCSVIRAPIAARRDWGFDWEPEFPPDLVGS